MRHLWLAVVLVCGALVFLPAVRAPLLLDDYVQVAMLEGNYPSQRSPFDLYNFVSDADRALLLERGILPWWSDPRITIRFLRPLSSILRFGDHSLFGAAPLPAHLHSLFWWSLSVVGLYFFLRRVVSERAARIGTAVFAVAPCHGLPLAWLSNREVLVSLALGTVALGAYVRFRRGERRQGLVAAAAFALALLAGEYALGVVGYFVAFELVAKDALARRALRLAPIAALSAAYLVARRVLHCATIGSGFYRDPLQEPWRFLQTAPYRLAAVFTDAWFASESPSWGIPRWLLPLIAVALAVVLWRALAHAWSAIDDEERRGLRALVLGSIVALLPVLAVSPSARTLGMATIGIAGAIGVIVDRAWFRESSDAAPAGELVRGLAAIFVFARFFYGPATAFTELVSIRDGALAFASGAHGLGARVDASPRREVSIVRGEWQTMLWAPFSLNERHEAPARWRVLSLARHALVLRRDERTIEIVAPHDVGLFPLGEDDLFRSESNPIAFGEEIRFGDATATLFDLPKSTGVRVAFDEPIADDELWVAQKGTDFVAAPPPAIGFGTPVDR